MADLLGIGNALYDVISLVDEEQLDRFGLSGKTMDLIDQHRLEELQASVKPAMQGSGGSVANSTVCYATLGGKSKFIGKVGRDKIGQLFASDLRDSSVLFDTTALKTDIPTAQCFVLVTPDAQRRFLTYLGATTQLTVEDLDQEAVENAKVMLLEGYLWTSATAVELIVASSKIAKNCDTKVAMSLSDPSLVEQFSDSMKEFADEFVDILIGNELEFQALYSTTDFEQTLEAAGNDFQICIITRGPQGSCVINGDQQFDEPAFKVASIVDTTGAGDAYAGGFFYEFIQEKPIPQCMHTATELAAKTISKIGGRPDRGYLPKVNGLC